MGARDRIRFAVQTAVAAGAAVLAIVAVIWPGWIETVVRVDPDRHSGSLEWLIVAGLALVAAALGLAARRTWRRCIVPA